VCDVFAGLSAGIVSIGQMIRRIKDKLRNCVVMKIIDRVCVGCSIASSIMVPGCCFYWTDDRKSANLACLESGNPCKSSMQINADLVITTLIFSLLFNAAACGPFANLAS